jgi:hypothetical protein
MTWTSIWAIMSSLLYQLSYSLYNADKRFALLYTNHESVMLLLHQSAFIFSPRGIWILILTVKMLRLDHLTTGPCCITILILYKARCKYRTYFYRLQNGCITFMLTRLKIYYVYFKVIKKLDIPYLKLLKILQLEPITYILNIIYKP